MQDMLKKRRLGGGGERVEGEGSCGYIKTHKNKVNADHAEKGRAVEGVVGGKMVEVLKLGRQVNASHVARRGLGRWEGFEGSCG